MSMFIGQVAVIGGMDPSGGALEGDREGPGLGAHLQRPWIVSQKTIEVGRELDRER